MSPGVLTLFRDQKVMLSVADVGQNFAPIKFRKRGTSNHCVGYAQGSSRKSTRSVVDEKRYVLLYFSCCMVASDVWRNHFIFCIC